jgi:hypothetical protein
MFELPLHIDGFNETDVREEIIAPLLRHLGYRAQSSANIIREQSLRYPRAFLGRKNRRRDPPLRGRADYILEVEGPVRWTIEAKPPTAPISLDDVEQAYSYACHPEVRAVLFAIVNGTEVRVYQTNRGPDAAPILALAYADIPGAIQRIENLLGPQSVMRDYPEILPDAGRPIGTGLRSIVRIVSGFVEFQECNPTVPLLSEITMSIIEGAIERAEGGRLVVYVQARSPFRSVNELNERLGLQRLELTSVDEVLSTETDSPTTFRQEMTVTLPAGATFPNLVAEGELELTRALTCQSTTVATGILKGNRFAGRFHQRYDYRDLPNVGDKLTIDAIGRFETVLA